MSNKRSALLNSSSLLILGAGTVLGGGQALAFDANSLPTGGTVTGGSASIATSGNTLTVKQTSNRAIIDWRSFDIGSNAQANFNQPGTGSIAVNRVNGATDPSRIDGGLKANGQVWILNPNGVFFGKTARVDAAGVVATTANIDDKAFMAGSNRLQMTGGDSGQVVNEGHITVGQGGLAAFVAPSVRNSGVIRARVGKITLAAGDTYTLDLAGDRLVELGLGAGKAVVDQSGKIVNPGGTIEISAKAAGQVVDSLVNMSGVTNASSVKTAGGKIILGADDITVASSAQTSADGTSGGQITAVANKTGNYDGSFSAQGTTGDGGQIETSGHSVHVASTIKVSTKSAKGKTGNWTLDPATLTVGDTGAGSIGGDNKNSEDATISADTVVTALASNNVTLQAQTKIIVDSAIDASTNGVAHNLTLADQDGGGLTVDLNAPITLHGTGVLSGQATLVNVAATGRIQNGVDVALAGSAANTAIVSVAQGTYNENLSIAKSGLTLQSVAGRDATTINGQGNTALGTIIVASGANNVTIGQTGHGFTIVGIDNSDTHQESAAINFAGPSSVSGTLIQGNRITANGDYGLLTGSSAAVSNLRIDGNIFDGQTFTGSTAGGWGFTGSGGETDQFNTANTPRQLVTINPNAGTTGVSFTNNQVTGTAGALNGSGQEQGNTLVTIDANNATITGNTFAGTTTRYGAQLRSRGTTVNISGNIFDSSGLGQNAAVLEYKSPIFTGNIGSAPTDLASLMAANSFTGRAVWNSQAAARLTASQAYDVGVSITGAISGAAAGDTIQVEGGTYSLASQLEINKDITLQGDAGARASITAGHDFAGNNAGNAMILVDANKAFTLKNVKVDGSGHAVGQALFSLGNTTVDNVDFANIAGQASGQPYDGAAIVSIGGTVPGGVGSDTNGHGGSASVLTVTNSTFENIGREGILVKGDGATANIDGITYTGKGNGDWLDYGVEAGAGAHVTLTNSTITGNIGVASADQSTSSGVLVTSYYGPGTIATLTGNTITGNTSAVGQGYDDPNTNTDNDNDRSIVTARGNNFAGNGIELSSNNATANFTGNWWGTTNDADILASMSGLRASSVNFSSFLASGTDTSAAAGFQGDFSKLIVTSLGGQSSTIGRIDEAVSLADAGATIDILPGSYSEGITGVSYTTYSGGEQFGLFVPKDGITLQGVDAGGNPTTDPSGVTINAAHQSNFSSQDYISGRNVTIAGVTLTPNAAASKGKLLDVVGDGFTLKNSVLDLRGTGTEVALYFDDLNQGNSTVTDIENFSVTDNTFYGFSLPYTGGFAGESSQIVMITNGVGVNSDATGRQFTGNTLIGGGAVTGATASNQFGLEMEGVLPGINWLLKDVGPVTIANNSFSGVAVPVRLRGTTAQDLSAVLASNTFAGAVLDYAGSSNTAATGSYNYYSNGGTFAGPTGTAHQVAEQKIFSSIQDAVNFNGLAAGDTVKALAGTYAGGIAINTNGITLGSASGNATDVKITAGGSTGSNALTINGDNVTVQNLEIDLAPTASANINGVAISGTADHATVTGLTIRGEVSGSYVDYGFTNAVSRGIAISSGASNFTVTGNDIRNVRTGIVVDGADGHNPGVPTNSGSIARNVIDNTKSALSIQYSDGTGIAINGNSQDHYGNEWGEIWYLQGAHTGEAPSATQSALLAAAAANGSWTVEDLAYATSNRTAVTVSANATSAAAGTAPADTQQGTPRAPLLTIQAGIAAVVSGGTVNLNNGTYVIASGGNYINVNKSLNLIGQSEAGVIIDARNASTYGLRVTASDGPVTLENFTLYGSTGTNSYGLKAEATQGLTLANITSKGAAKSEFDLNGVVNGTLTNLTADGASVATGASTAGNGISLTDSQNVTIINSITENNQWGGLALYQSNSPSGYPLQETGITVDGSNTFHEANGIYAQDQSSTNDFGTINLSGQGVQFIATVPTGTSDGTYYYFQQTQQGAIDQAATGAAGAVQGYAGNVSGNNVFTVGTSTGGTALSVNAALGQSTSGGIINVLDGNYAETVALTAPRTVDFGNVTLTGLSSSAAAAGSVLSGNVTAGSVALNGGVALDGDLNLDTSAANGAVAVASVAGAGHDLTIASGTGGTSLGDASGLGALSATGPVTLTGGTYTAASLDLGATTLVNGTTLTASGAVDVASVAGNGNDLTVAAASTALGEASDLGALSVTGPVTLTGSSYTAASLDLGTTTLVNGTTLTASGVVDVASVAGNGNDLTVAAASTALGEASDLGALSVTGPVTLTGSSYTAASLDLGTTTLSNGTTLTASAVDVASVTGNGNDLTVTAASTTLGDASGLGALSVTGPVTLAGGSYTAASLDLGATTLSNDTTLDTSAANGAIILASADGAHDLTLASGTGAIALGGLGAATRLGAVTVNGPVTLTGDTYDGASFAFAGPVTLTADSTTIDSTQSAAAAGTIVFAGDIFGTTDGGQSLVLAAGSGTGAKSANGDITLQNAGLPATRLDSLNVSGDDFLALTVNLKGDFNSKLAGNQVFAADTLNAGGSVNTDAGGDVSGHIVAQGDVALTTPGTVSGNISGDSLVLNSGAVENATIAATNVDATVAGGFNAAVTAVNNASIAAGSVSGNISGTNLTLNSGTVNNAVLSGTNVNANVSGAMNATVRATGNANVTASSVTGSIAAANVNAIVSGAFNATVNATNNATVAANSVSGTFSGATVSLSGQTVTGQVTANTLNVAAQSGSVSGDFTPGTVSSGLSLNGSTVPPGGANAPSVNAQQLVVEGFTLPAGTQIAANGQLILPAGTVIGLLAPGGGTPKVTIVQTVQQLGELLDQGYVAIVIDLKGRKKAVRLAAAN